MSGEIAFALISQIILIATRKKYKRHYNAVVSLIFHPVKFMHAKVRFFCFRPEMEANLMRLTIKK